MGGRGAELGLKPAQAPPEHRLVAVDHRLAERALDLGNRFHLGGVGAAEKNSVGIRPVVLARTGLRVGSRIVQTKNDYTRDREVMSASATSCTTVKPLAST